MKIAYFDCFSGISGDMAVGALLDAGVPLDVVTDALQRLGFHDDQLRVSTRSIVRSAIHATKFDVATVPRPHSDRDAGELVHEHSHEAGLEQEHDHDHDHAHPHSHPHDHAHPHSHPHDHPSSHVHEHGEQRSFADIMQLLESSELAEGIRDRARAIFRAIAIGESRIHNVTVEEVHFHEVGALDSIADVVATAACLEHLGVERVYSSVIPLGSHGLIDTQHGSMPLPAPATLEILKGFPVRLTALPFELTTPTGAGIIKALSSGTLAAEQLQVERVGFGAGTRELPDRPNLLRLVVGEWLSSEEQDTVVVIETNIDDMNPQVYPHLLERLMELGALDAFLIPVVMKRGRPGTLLSVVAPPAALDELTKLIYRETTSIGVRYREMNRRKLPREAILVPTEYGVVRMKCIDPKGEGRVAVEFEEARRIARERSIPLPTVLRALEEVARAVAADQPGR